MASLASASACKKGKHAYYESVCIYYAQACHSLKSPVCLAQATALLKDNMRGIFYFCMPGITKHKTGHSGEGLLQSHFCSVL